MKLYNPKYNALLTDIENLISTSNNRLVNEYIEQIESNDQLTIIKILFQQCLKYHCSLEEYGKVMEDWKIINASIINELNINNQLKDTEIISLVKELRSIKIGD